MAEELDIRSIWQNSKDKGVPKSLQINMLERKGTRTTLYWIKTILWIEFWLTIAGAPIAIYYFNQIYSLAFSVPYGVICFLYLFYYHFLIKQINRFSYDRNVIDNLKKIYGYLRFYLLHYKVVIWISLIVGMIIGIMEPENQAVLSKVDSIKDWAKFIAVLAVMIGIMGAIMTLLVHLIYGRKIKRLKRMVKDLESEE